jgi:hypothetical protein
MTTRQSKHIDELDRAYLICIVFCWLFPAFRMVDLWTDLLPGFEWTVSGILFGVVGSYLYGWYIAILWVPLYEIFSRRYQTSE